MEKEYIQNKAAMAELGSNLPESPEEIARLGCRYCNGDGVKKDYDIGCSLFKKTVELGDIYSMYLLGLIYSREDYDKHDPETSAMWYLRAAERGDDEAQFMMGVLYDNGRGVALDDSKAFCWYKKSALQGLMNAQFNVGYDYDMVLEFQKTTDWLLNGTS